MIPVSYWIVRILWLCSAAMMAPGCVSLVHWLRPCSLCWFWLHVAFWNFHIPPKELAQHSRCSFKNWRSILSGCWKVVMESLFQLKTQIFFGHRPQHRENGAGWPLISMILGPKDKPPTTSWQKVAIENIPGVGKASTVDYLNRQYPYIVAIGVGVTFGLVTDLRRSRSVAGADPSLHRWGFKLCQSPNLPICWWRWWAPGRTRISILVGGLEHLLFFHSVGNFIIPTDELHHFSNG